MIQLSEPFTCTWAHVNTKTSLILEEMRTKDSYYWGHVMRSCTYALEFGRQQRLNQTDLQLLYLAAFFHDIGKLLIPANILNKSDSLTPAEYELMNTHPVLGEEICSKLGPFEQVAHLVACHHERPNGTGYPKGLKGREIPELARILAVIEVYDALRSKRSYKPPFPLEQSLEILHQNAANGNLDAQVVSDFARFAENMIGQHSRPKTQTRPESLPTGQTMTLWI